MIPFPIPVINMVNRAWHGTRIAPLGTVPHPEDPKKTITFSIEFHHTRGQYFVNEEVTTPRIVVYRNGKKRVRHDTTGHYTGFSDTVQGCIKWVNDKYGIFLNLLNDPVRIAYEDKELFQKKYLQFESWEDLME
mgnify:CR=1 FL=1|jgi:hypothetical protein